LGICRFSTGQLTRNDVSSTLIKFASVEVKRLKFLMSVIFRLGKKIDEVVDFSGVVGISRRVKGIRLARDHALRHRGCA
jgi:hypothetical protein